MQDSFNLVACEQQASQTTDGEGTTNFGRYATY